MQAFYLLPVLAAFGQILPITLAMKQVFGINIGGAEYTTQSGIHLMADPRQEDKWHSDANLGACGSDAVVFTDCRFTYEKMAYTVQLDGDGRYALGLGFSDEPNGNERSRFNVLVNGQLVLEKFDMVEKCGAFKTCNQVFYFDVCHGHMRLNGKATKVVNNEISVEFEAAGSYAVADAIFVFKDTSDGMEKVFTDGTTVKFSTKKFSCHKHDHGHNQK